MYRTIKTDMWIDPQLKSINPETKLLWVYLLTNNHTHISGVYHIPVSYIAYETGLSIKQIESGIKVLQSNGWLFYDGTNDIVFIVRYLSLQAVNIDNPKILQTVEKQLISFKHSTVLTFFLSEYPTDRLSELKKYATEGVYDRVWDRVCNTLTVPVTDTVTDISIGDEQINLPSVKAVKPVKEFSDRLLAITDAYIKNVKQIYPSAKLDRLEQAGYFQKLMDKHGYSYRALGLVVSYIMWTATDGQELEKKTFNWQLNIRSAAKLLKPTKDGTVTYFEALFVDAKQQYYRSNQTRWIDSE